MKMEIKLNYEYLLSKKLMIIYKDNKKLCHIENIPSILVAKEIFKEFKDEINCYLDSFSNGEINYDKFEWIIESALEKDYDS